jgi:hypothetical protein
MCVTRVFDHLEGVNISLFTDNNLNFPEKDEENLRNVMWSFSLILSIFIFVLGTESHHVGFAVLLPRRPSAGITGQYLLFS